MRLCVFCFNLSSSCDIDEPDRGSAPLSFLGSQLIALFSLDCCLLLSICVIFRCVLHPLPLPLSSCLGCIPPLIGLPSLRFYAVGSSLFLLSVCFCLCSLFYRDDVLCWLLLARPFLYAFHAHLRFPVDLVWFRLSCDHGWTRSGSVNVRKQQQQQQHLCVCVFSSHSFWTLMDVPAGVTQEEGNTGFSIHLLSAVLA